MNDFHRIILYHKCVCGILLRKLKKYSKYTMKTCQENLWHIYMMCYFNLVIGWRMQGLLKGQSHILKTAIMVLRKRLSRAIAATFWPRGWQALCARRLRGLNVKKNLHCVSASPWFSKVKSNKNAKPWTFVIKSRQFHQNIANRISPSPLLRCAALNRVLKMVTVSLRCRVGESE